MSGRVLRVAVEAVELRGPGLANWIEARPILAGSEPYRSTPVALEPPNQLSPAERRRAIPSVKLALAVGAAAVEQSGRDASTLPAVFASSGADGDTISAILTALMARDREVSPTRFHNSVHNAPSGYWGIAMQSREAVTSLSCHDASFAAGLLEAAVQAVSADRPVLLVAYDLPYPEPLNHARRIEGSFGVAFVVSPVPSDRALVELALAITAAGKVTRCADCGLEDLRRGNPAARSLPLLAMLAGGLTGRIRLDFSHGALEVGVFPC
jgi:Beta-ketoacyl synthase, N-terminal domain